MSRATLRNSRRLTVIGVLAVILTAVVGAVAFWTTSGSGSANASIGTLSAPGTPSVPRTGATVNLSWSAATVTGGGTVKYHVERRDDPGSTWTDVCGSTDAAPITATNCDDTPGTGTFAYRVTSRYASWHTTGPESNLVAGGPPAYVTAIDRTDASPTNAATLHWSVTFSEPVTGVDATDFAVAASGVTGASIAGVTGSGSGPYTVTVSGVAGNGTLGLNLVDDDSIVNAASSPLGSAGGGANGDFTGQAYTVDTTPPTVSTVSSSLANASYTVGQVVPLTVTFSESVDVAGTPQLLLETGATDRQASYAAGSGSATLTFNYTVQVGDTSSDLDYVGSGALTLNGGTIKDAATNTATLTLAAPGAAGSLGANKAIVIDTTAPAVTLTAPANGSATNGTTPTISGAAGNATGDSTTVTVRIYNGTGTGGTVAQTIPVTRSAATWTTTPATLPDGTYTAQATQPDTAGNTATSTANTFTVDATAPTVTVNQKAGQADPTNTLPILYTVTFSEPVTGFTAADLTRGGTSTGGTPTVTGSGATYEISSGTLTTNGTLTFAIAANRATDLAGNNNTASTSTDNSVTYDTAAPALSLTAPANGSATSSTTPTLTGAAGNATGDSATVTVRIYVGTGTGGTVAQTILVTRSAATWTTTAAALAQGTYTAQATQTDTAGNTGTSTASTFTVDTTAPTLSTLQMLDSNDNGKIDRVVATFNETLVASTATAPWTLANVPSGGSLASVSVAGTVATLTITEGAGAANTAVGSFTVALAQSATGIRDAAGNQSSFAAAAPTDKAGPVPVVLADTTGTTDGKFEAGDTMTVTFSEAVTGVAATSNVALIDKGGSGTDDGVSMPGLLNAQAGLGNSGYITGNGNTASFNGSPLSQPAANQVRVTLAACSGACASITAPASASSFTFTPVTTITDAAANAAVGSITVTIKLF
ncbi:MAG: Fibronectin type domain protein [Solirubrobacterales bacterium]|nr:Fibronectin type domain protein [Solirubrobacterales bacterium]